MEEYVCPKCKQKIDLSKLGCCCIFSPRTIYRIDIPNIMCGDCRIFLVNIKWAKDLIRDALRKNPIPVKNRKDISWEISRYREIIAGFKEIGYKIIYL
jgi:hypothetical protein